jgi:hypothetical protein
MTSFRADTLKEFMEAAAEKFGAGGLGETEYHVNSSYVFRNGKLIDVSFTLAVTIDFATFGGGKPDKANQEAITHVVHLGKVHEGKHKAGYEATFSNWKPQAVKDLKAGTYADEDEAKDAIAKKVDEINDKMKAACLDLHSKEGYVDVMQSGGNISVTMKPAGASGCE